jgi:hypothetical protein
MEVEELKGKYSTGKKVKKWRWISPGYINFNQPLTFEKILKEKVVKLPNEIPMDFLADKYVNYYY